jgi:hypothetical protein
LQCWKGSRWRPKRESESLVRPIHRNFFIFILSWFSKNKWSNQNFLRNVHLASPPWGTALGVVPTVGCTGRWGQVPTAAGFLASWPAAVGVLASCSTAATPWRRGPRRQRHAYLRGRALPSAPPSLLPHSSKPSAFNPSEHFWLRYVSKFSPV